MLTSSDPRVVNYFNSVNHYAKTDDGFFKGSAKSQNGFLYVIGGNGRYAVQIVLPVNLLDFANAASGNMPGNRPVGIRAGNYSDAKSAAAVVAKIFSSTEDLVKFINSSECDAAEYIPSTSSFKVKPSKLKLTDDRSTREAFYDKYKFNDLVALRKLFGEELVRREYDLLTINEFELRFGLIA
jgi:hypothetical protein